MALIPIFEIVNIVTCNSVDKEKIKIIMICVHPQCKQNKQRYYRIEHACHKSKFSWPVRPYSTSGTLFVLFFSTKMSKQCKNKQYFTSSLNAWMGYSTR